MNQLTENCVPERQPIAFEVAGYAQGLAGRAQALADKVITKLHPVMSSEQPIACGTAQTPQTDYPPLFSELRGSLRDIESALESISSALSRTEL